MSDKWRELRSRNIGGSEIASLFGLGYKTYYKLWHEKRGNIEEDNLDGVERVQAGNFMESAAIEWANSRWGFNFYQPDVYVEHANVKGMGCTPDAYCHDNKDIMAQVKNVDSLQFAKEWEHEGEIITKAPLHILLQVQHEMECDFKAQNYLIVLVGGNRLFYMACDYDSETASILRKKVVEFWDRKTPPKPDFNKDLKAIKSFRDTLKATEFEDFSSDKRYYKIAKEAQKLKHQIATRSDKLEALQAEIYSLSLNADLVKCKDISVKFTKRKGSEGRKASTSMKIISEAITL